MEEALVWDLFGDDSSEHALPPDFRFHPTDEELITYYLASKVFNGVRCGMDMVEVDLNRCEPWELPDAAKMGEREWYFFSLRDRKYPTGLRTNRATGAGYWKATGKDREVNSASTGALLGMKKTLVFYKGRAPRGEKTKWVLHEYRLDGDLSCCHACKEEWVICRIFNKTGADTGADKSPCYPYPNYIVGSSPPPPPPSFTPQPPPPPPPALQSQQDIPQTQTFLQPHHHYLLQDPIPLFPLSLPLSKSHCPPQEELMPSSWIDAYLQSHLVYEMGLGPLGLSFGGGTTVYDVPMLGPTASVELA